MYRALAASGRRAPPTGPPSCAPWSRPGEWPREARAGQEMGRAIHAPERPQGVPLCPPVGPPRARPRSSAPPPPRTDPSIPPVTPPPSGSPRRSPQHSPPRPAAPCKTDGHSAPSGSLWPRICCTSYRDVPPSLVAQMSVFLFRYPMSRGTQFSPDGGIENSPPCYASASSERTRPAFNFSLSRYELPRMFSVTA